jgi:cobalt-zinc-cadmium efflux system membrane fusion protein
MNSLFHSVWSRRIAIALIAALPLPSPAAGKAPSPAGVVGCLLTPIRVADVGTPTAGVINSVEVDRGDLVHAGQVLVRLQSDTERASLGSAQTRADADATIGAAKAAALLSHSKLERAENLFREEFISSLALEQARAEDAVAVKTLQQAIEQRDAYRSDVKQARAVVQSRVLKSPFSGIVVDRMANPGERVELYPVLRIADVSQLKVEVVVPAKQFGTIQLGGVMMVHPELPNAVAKAATVTQVDTVIDAASNTFRIRLLLPNEDGAVPAGARCRVDLPISGM